MKRTLLCLTTIFYLNFLSRIIVGPLLPGLEEDMALNHAQSSSLFMLLSSGYFVAILCSGFVSARIGHRGTVSLSAFCIACSLFMTSFASNLMEMQSGLFCMGMSAGLYLPSAIAVISSEFPENAWGRSFAVHELAPNLAFVSAPFWVAYLIGRCPWQLMFRVEAAVLGSAGMLFYLANRQGKEKGTAPDIRALRKVFKTRGIVGLISMFSMGILGTLGVFNLLPLFLVTVHGMNEAAANSITGFSRIATLGAAIGGGWLADKIGAVKTMGLVIFASGVLVLSLGFAKGYLLEACIFLQPVIAVCFFPAAFSAVSSLVSPELRNVVISVVVPLAYVAGGGCIPWFIGFMADAGMFSHGIAAAGGIMIGCSLYAFFYGQEVSSGG